MVSTRTKRLNRILWGSVTRPAMLVTALAMAGCGESNVGVVSGTITVDGSPAKSGSIAFFPVDRKSSTAGTEIIEGRYSARVPLGKFKVEIRVPKVVGEKKLYDTPDSPMQKILAESLPSKYNDQTELAVDVAPGENNRDFDLTTR